MRGIELTFNARATAEDNRGWQFLDENTFNSAGFAIAQAAKKKGQQSWYYRFNAPQTQKYPAYYGASHSADNWVSHFLVPLSAFFVM